MIGYLWEYAENLARLTGRKVDEESFELARRVCDSFPCNHGLTGALWRLHLHRWAWSARLCDWISK